MKEAEGVAEETRDSRKRLREGFRRESRGRRVQAYTNTTTRFLKHFCETGGYVVKCFMASSKKGMRNVT